MISRFFLSFITATYSFCLLCCKKLSFVTVTVYFVYLPRYCCSRCCLLLLSAAVFVYILGIELMFTTSCLSLVSRPVDRRRQAAVWTCPAAPGLSALLRIIQLTVSRDFSRPVIHENIRPGPLLQTLKSFRIWLQIYRVFRIWILANDSLPPPPPPHPPPTGSNLTHKSIVSTVW
jgi:hypothetical protein